ncbi:MAG: LexA family protein [Acidobacteriaceae bacterium]
MADIGSEIRNRRERLGWTVTKLATLAGISGPFLSRVERGAYYSRETLQKIAGALGVTVDALYASGSRSNVEEVPLGWRRIPVLNSDEVGRWTTSEGIPKDEGLRESIVTDLEHPPSTFAMRIKGDSMEPRFQPGDVVVVNPTLQPDPGDFVVATDPNGEATFRQYRNAGINENGAEVFELVPLNALHAPLRSDRVELAIAGVMVEHRQYRRR